MPGMDGFPDSCKCKSTDERCIGDIYAFGCFKDLSAWFVMIETILGIVAIGVAVRVYAFNLLEQHLTFQFLLFQLIGAIFAISLASSVRRRMHTV